MKRATACALVVLLAGGGLLMVAPAALAAPEAPSGFRAVVTGATPPPGSQFIEFRLRISPDDPNQDIGSYQYNLTVDAGTPVDLGDILNQQSCTRGEGFITCTTQFDGATFQADYWVHAWDGTDEGPASCIVTVDTGVLGDYDACGTLDTTYNLYHCIPRSPENVTPFASVDAGPAPEGWDFLHRVRLSNDGSPGGSGRAVTNMLPLGLGFDANPPAAALNLPGDSTSMEVRFSLRAMTDGLTSIDRIFLSTEPVAVSDSTAGDRLTTGAWRNGWSLRLVESGNNWAVLLEEHRNGIRFALFSDTWSTGIHANQFRAGLLRVDPWAGVITISLGGETATVPITAGGFDPSSDYGFYSWWLAHYQARTRYEHPPTGTHEFSLCLFQPAPEFGGGSGLPGTPFTTGQDLETFPGEGGAIGPPQFPGLDMQESGDALGIDPIVLGWILAAIVLMGTTVLGFVLAGPVGAGVGFLVALPMVVFLGLIPLWILVVLFLVMAGLVVAAWGRGS